ncbi:MAG: sigma-70 family RNA polymerase sigma factor [Kiritimatiellae bacterium]|nr:sigma-70 family RNA polymerase sigma factor [Kiritimatiellia bacterium]
MDVSTHDRLTAAFAEHRQRLIALATKKLNPILLKRMGEEDVLSEAYVNAAKRLDYLAAHDDVPVYYKLRTILLQTICDIERRHLQAQGRDAYRELRIAIEESRIAGDDGCPVGEVCAGEIPADITSPASRVDRDERHAILRRALAAMPENDRAILVMRHFDGMGNAECAAALGLTEKAASIRYVRALERLQQKLVEVSCFRKN